MSISNELMYAILAMDSYNQGYGEGIKHGKLDIGTASLIDQSDIEDGDPGVNAGFYAAAYSYNNETVISYRGTDIAGLIPWFDTPGGDIWNGYGTSVGSPNNDQAHLAAEFFQSVTNTQNSDPQTASVKLTGHSLGGGLAGFIGAIYHQEALLFDNMPFELAANKAYGQAASWELR